MGDLDSTPPAPATPQSGSLPHSPRPAGGPLGWIVGIVLFLVIGFLCVHHWKSQADRERAALRDLVGRLASSTRTDLAAEWGDKARWIPSMDAAEALAVLPRTRRKDFEAIYILYRDDRVRATLALTPIGGFFNGRPLDKRAHPRTLLAEPPTPVERADLRALVALLESDLESTRRDHPLDVQSIRYGWTAQVVATARLLLAAQP